MVLFPARGGGGGAKVGEPRPDPTKLLSLTGGDGQSPPTMAPGGGDERRLHPRKRRAGKKGEPRDLRPPRGS